MCRALRFRRMQGAVTLRSRTRARRAIGLALTFGFAAPAFVSGNDEIGVVGGIAFAGRQDLTIEERASAEGPVLNVVQELKLPVARGGAWGISFVRWTDGHPRLGWTVDALYWRNSLVITGIGDVFGRRTLRQERYAVVPSFTVRLPVGERDGPFFFGTIGLGVVDSRLIGGDQRVGFGLSAAIGGEVPLIDRSVFLRLETRYLITHDFDSDDGKDKNLEFSGSPSWTTARRVFGGHQDTRFLPVVLGVFWRF